MATDPRTLKAVIDHIRRCFGLLDAVSDRMLAELGLTASTRAILEYIDENGPATVPQIAAAKTVTRQSVQALVDRLSDNGLVALADNPGHRRSRFVVLTEEGARIFAEVRSREARLLDSLARTLDSRGMLAAAAALGGLRQGLAPLADNGDGNPGR